MEQNLFLGKYILIIEDDKPIADLICYFFKSEGIKAKATNTGSEGLDLLNKNDRPNLVILDLSLPDISGFDVCKEIIEKHSIPVIMLTAKSNITDKVRGLEIGADDYITKPFDVLELAARVKTVLRRVNPSKQQNIVKLPENIIINMNERKVFKNGKLIALTPKEFDLLLFFVKNKGQVFSRNHILSSVWSFDYCGDTRTVDIHVRRLRKKLDENSDVSFIETVFGVGYMIPS